jgi:hypothetical protein
MRYFFTNILMAKNFPYFKFTVADWLTGDIVFESFEAQGLFINICAIYWQRDGKLSIDDVKRRYKNPPELTALVDRFIHVKDGIITIQFLDEQFTDASQKSIINSKNGAKGGRKRSEKQANANRPPSERLPNSSNIDKIREEEIREENNTAAFFDRLSNDPTALEQVVMILKLKAEHLGTLIQRFHSANGDKHLTYWEYLKHFKSWSSSVAQEYRGKSINGKTPAQQIFG